MSVAARIARLERDTGAQAGACAACLRSFVTRRVDRDATPEQIDAARRCTACGRLLEVCKLVGMTPEEWDAI